MWGMMTVFRFDILNFFQYYLIRVLLILVLNKIILRSLMKKFAKPSEEI